MSTTDKYLELWKVLAASPVVGLEILAPVGEYQRVTLITEDNVRVTFLLAGQYDERYLDVVMLAQSERGARSLATKLVLLR